MQNPATEPGEADGLELRSATPRDREFARATHHAAYEDVVRRQFGAWDAALQDRLFSEHWDPARTTMLVLDESPCGYCVIEDRDTDVHLRNLVVHPAYQGRGVGTRVIRRVQARASERGVPVRLRTFHMNRARDLYERLGFRMFDRNDRHVLMEWRPASGRDAAGGAAAADPVTGPRIDHLLFGAPDLETGMDQVERRLGARPAPGGRHPSYGTRNALLSLGPDCYLEVIAPDPDLPIPDRGIGFGVERLTQPRLVGWALRHPQIEAAAERAGLGSVESGSRERADGGVLRWRLTDPYLRPMDGVVPFLIDWGETAHPAPSAPPGGRLTELRIEHPAPDEVTRVLETLGCGDVSVQRGEAPRLVALIGTADGTVELT